MSFFLQLKLLLWKNYILRKRHWMRLIMEILWPLILFLILVAVRTRGLRKFNHQCHFDEKIMPSAGLLPYAQSLVCSFNNTCHKHEQRDFTMLTGYNGSTLTQVLEDFQKVLSVNIDQEDEKTLEKISQDVSTLRLLWQKIRKDPTQALSGFRTLNVSSVIKNPTRLRNEVIFWAISANLTDLLMTDQDFLDNLMEANIKPDALTSDDLLKFVVNPKNTICQSDLPTKIIVSEKISSSDIQEALEPLCRLPFKEIRKLLSLVEKQIDWESLEVQVQTYVKANGGKPLNLGEWKEARNLAKDVGRDLMDSEVIKLILGPVAKFAMDFSSLLSELGNRGSALLVAEARDESNGTLTEELENATNIYAKLQKVICGRDLSSEEASGSLLGGSSNQFETLRENLRLKDDNSTMYQYDNTTTPECNAMMEQLESNTFTNLLWSLVKPYVRGKILYTPDTPATRRLVSIVNATFAPIDQFRILTQEYVASYSKIIRNVVLNGDNQELIKVLLFSSDNGTEPLFETFLESPLGQNLLNQSGSDVEEMRSKVENFFDGNFNQTWNTTMNQLDTFVANLSLYISCFEFNKFVGVDSEFEMEQLGIQLVDRKQLWAALVFNDFPANQKTDDLPPFIQYKIRMDADSVDSTRYVEDRIPRPIPRRRPPIDLKYLYFGFSFLQDLLDHAIISEQSGRPLEDLPGMSLQQFPYPCSVDDRFILAISRTFPLFMTLSWIYSSAMIIKSIVYEKERRLKETMRVMGLGNLVHWVSWFIDSFAVMMFSSGMLSLLLKYGNILIHTEVSLIFAFMSAYTISTIMLSFFLSTLFNRANIAAAAGGIIFFCIYLPYSFMVVWESKITHSIRIASSLLSNVAFGFGCAYLAHYEESGEGATWSNIWTSPLMGTGDKYSLAGAIGMLLVDSVLYGLLTWYIEAVFPGEYGVPKPWYFFTTKSYWLGPTTIGVSPSDSDLELGVTNSPKNIEKEPSHLNLGVSVQHLHKVYSNGKVAIEDLNLAFYEGQITSFLGHNGAGKTTTISILTGLFPPSAGTAKINGLDIRTEMDTIRQSLGVCPQHNVLFDELTVDEHLWFYARLKGRKPSEVHEESEKMVDDLVLRHKRDEISKNLSGGMQRKLSIATAFVGGSRTVILDEPTAGVDPYSRRGIWNLLIKHKANRTIIMSTHFMDEADLLGDRIAIINNGKLVCIGSSLFLRSRYGNGYYLTLVVDDGSDQMKSLEHISEEQKRCGREDSQDPDEDPDPDNADGNLSDVLKTPPTRNVSAKETEEDSDEVFKTKSSDLDLAVDDEGISDVAKVNGVVINPSKALERARVLNITKFISRYIENAQLLEHIGTEITYILPVQDVDGVPKIKDFEFFFQALDSKMDQLQIKSYGLSDTTLEEIFLKVASNVHDGEICRTIQHEDVTDHGRFPTRVRSASSRSIELKGPILTQNEQKILGVGAAGAKVEESIDDELQERTVNTPDGKEVKYVEIPSIEEVPPKVTKNFPAPEPEYTSGSLFLKHVFALEVKRFHYAKRNKKGFFCEILLPACFVCLAMLLTLILPALEMEKPLEVSPWNYPTWGLNYPTETFFANKHPEGDWPDRYFKALVSKSSFGTRCIQGNTIGKSCLAKGPNITHLTNDESLQNSTTVKECFCGKGTMDCPVGAEGPEPPKVQLASYDILANMTAHNISDFLMKTTRDYYKKRYGGFEFGVRNPIKNTNITTMERNLAIIIDKLPVPEEFGSPEFLASLVAGNFDDLVRTKMDNIRVWFNNKGWTSSVGYLNAVNNLVLRASIKSQSESLDFDWDAELKDQHKFGISVINHPMNLTEKQLNERNIRLVGISLLHAICVIFAMSFVPASFVVYLIEERVSKVKHLHFVSGVPPLTYWVSAIVWDLIMYLITTVLCVIIFIIFDAEAYVSEESLPALLVIMFLYGFATIPLMYPASFVFRVPSVAFVLLACVNLFIGIITTITVVVMENFDDEELQYIGNILKDVFLIFPQYCLGRGLMDLATEYNKNLIAGRFGLESTRSNRFEFDFTGKFMLCMFAQGVLLFSITLMIQYRVFLSLQQKLIKLITGPQTLKSSANSESVDDDVKHENERVLGRDVKQLPDVLVVKDLCKKYSRKGKLAVDHLTFGVKPGECFGLLGVNGAGKTTTFKMLTGDTEPSGGTAYVNGYSILTNLDQARRNLGYCPQFDALNPLLTGREHLRLYARLRGLSEASVNKYTEWCLKRLGLAPYADRAAGTYSGGNKRKLSTAIALIGRPSMVFLDEPTSGMDPGARRFLWNCVLEMIRGGQSVILTSHSMEECEALCTRLAIMVNGTFKCHGSIQHLKNKFGSGYTLTVRSMGEDSQKLAQFVKDTVLDAELKDSQLNQIQFHLPLKTTKLPHIFNLMEVARTKPELQLEDYSISQMTLDEVFIHFASKQTEEDEAPSNNTH